MRIASLKYFSLAAAFTVSLSLNAQAILSSTSATVHSTSQSAAQTSDLSAQLTQKIDSKNAHVGDAIAARTTSAATLPDGTRLPKNTKLSGQITDVRTKSKEDNNSHVAFAFDHAVLNDGKQVPIHAMLVALSVPAAIESDDFAAPVATGGMGSGGGVGLGGAPHVAHSLMGGATNTVGSLGNDAVRSAPSVSAGNVTQVNQAPAGNLPGVTFSSAASSNNSGSLDASGRNLSLSNGTQMSFAVSAGQR